jgi:hypothetical protein
MEVITGEINQKLIHRILPRKYSSFRFQGIYLQVAIKFYVFLRISNPAFKAIIRFHVISWFRFYTQIPVLWLVDLGASTQYMAASDWLI